MDSRVLILFLHMVLLIAYVAGKMSVKEEVEFHNCIACAEKKRYHLKGPDEGGMIGRASYMTCQHVLPYKIKRMKMDCAKRQWPGVEKQYDVFYKMCNDRTTIKKVVQCYDRTFKKAQFNKDEKARLTLFKNCLEQLNNQHCQDEEGHRTGKKTLISLSRLGPKKSHVSKKSKEKLKRLKMKSGPWKLKYDD